MTNSRLRDSVVVLAVGAMSAVGVSLVVAWPVALTVVVGGVLVWFGYQLAVDNLHRDWRQVEQQRAALDAEWQALQTRRIRAVFLEARRAMQEEALRSMRAERRFPTTDPNQEV